MTRIIITGLMAGMVGALAAAGCKAKAPTAPPWAAEEEDAPGAIVSAAGAPGGMRRSIPPARIYRMNGPWQDQVPVGVDPQTGQLVNFPAPTDLTPESTPLPLEGGWWLDRRGVGYWTAFTRWTYPQYRALAEAPTPRAILDSIIPGARVTDAVTLPMRLSQATADTSAVNAYIRQNLSKYDDL